MCVFVMVLSRLNINFEICFQKEGNRGIAISLPFMNYLDNDNPYVKESLLYEKIIEKFNFFFFSII